MPPRMQWAQRPKLQLRTLAIASMLAAAPGWTQSTQSTQLSDGLAARPAADCASWPGEPAPLPTVSERDPFLHAWAEARVGELRRLARALEGLDRVEARRFWEHALCIAPADELAREGVARATPAAVHRPEPGTRSTLSSGRPGPSVSLEAAIEIALSEPAAPLREPARVAAIDTSASEPAATPEPADPQPKAVAREPDREAPRDSPPPAEPPRFEHAEAVAALLQQAHFRSALERADDARSELSDERAGASALEQLAQVEVLAATAQVALGNTSAAERHFRQALDADPALELDASHPPKVQRIFQSARGARP